MVGALQKSNMLNYLELLKSGVFLNVKC